MRSFAVASLFAAAGLLAVGCSSADPDASTSAQDLENCSNGPPVLEAKAASVAFYEDASLAHRAATLSSASVVKRLALETNAGGRVVSHVAVVAGPGEGTDGWIATDDLRLRSPASGTCASGVEPQGHAAVVERVASPDGSLPAELAKATMLCAVGIGEAAGETVTDLAKSAVGLVEGGWSLVREVGERDADIVLMALGSSEARARLAQDGASDRQRAQAVVGVVGHAIPAIHAYLAKQHLYYASLDAPHQSEYLCNLLAKLEITALTFLAAPGASEVSSGALMKLGDANQMVAAAAEIPGRFGDSAFVKIVEQVASQQDDYIAQGESLWRDLVHTRDVAKKKEVLRELSDAENPLYFLNRVHDGNCANAAITTMLMLGSGHLVCALPYWHDYVVDGDFGNMTADVEKAGALSERASLYTGRRLSMGELMDFADQELADGQMALLYSDSKAGAHATLVVRLGDEIVNVNNQGWDRGVVAEGDALQSLIEWDRTWRERTGDSSPTYRVILTNQTIPSE